MTTKEGTRMDLHPLAIEHPFPVAALAMGDPAVPFARVASDWLRHVEADGSRVVVLPPDAEGIARRVLGHYSDAQDERWQGLPTWHQYDDLARAVLAALGVEQDDECFACHGTGTFEPSADEPPERRALTCAECKGTGVIGGEHPGATAYHCPDCKGVGDQRVVAGEDTDEPCRRCGGTGRRGVVTLGHDGPVLPLPDDALRELGGARAVESCPDCTRTEDPA